VGETKVMLACRQIYQKTRGVLKLFSKIVKALQQVLLTKTFFPYCKSLATSVASDHLIHVRERVFMVGRAEKKKSDVRWNAL